MFGGKYGFFDYKYNIAGYTGQDFGGVAQRIYLVASLIIIVVLLIILRKSNKEKVFKIVKYLGIFMTLMYIIKTTWESYYDIKLSGSFNTGLLPFDTCSIVMYACLIVGFGKGKIKDMATYWLMSGCIVGGIANMLYLNAFKYYPFFTFGAFYSMLWHLLMVFIGLLLIVHNKENISYKNMLYGYLFQVIFSLVIIPIDFIWDFDFMLYHYLGGVPIFEDLASKMNMVYLNPLLMTLLYFIAFNIIYILGIGIKKALTR